MNDDAAEKAYREKLKDVREAVKAAKRMMRSKKEGVRLRAIGLFVHLSEFEIALVEALKDRPETQMREERNPLVRRARLDR